MSSEGGSCVSVSGSGGGSGGAAAFTGVVDSGVSNAPSESELLAQTDRHTYRHENLRVDLTLCSKHRTTMSQTPSDSNKKYIINMKRTILGRVSFRQTDPKCTSHVSHSIFRRTQWKLKSKTQGD